LFLMPFYLIQGRGLNSAQAGLLLTAQPIVMAAIAPLSGTISDRIGSRLPVMLGMGILGAGLYLLSRMGPATPPATIIIALAVSGLGIGIFISPNNSALMGSAPHHRQGIAAGILATARNVGMVLGVGLSGAIYTTILSYQAANTPNAIFPAVSASFLAAVGFAIAGLLISIVRPKPEKDSLPSP
jgi:MFS family permease